METQVISLLTRPNYYQLVQVNAQKKWVKKAIETVLAIASESDQEVADETADLLYHLFVALRSRGISLDSVGESLAKRQGMSGIVEKQNRTNS